MLVMMAALTMVMTTPLLLPGMCLPLAPAAAGDAVRASLAWPLIAVTDWVTLRAARRQNAGS